MDRNSGMSGCLSLPNAMIVCIYGLLERRNFRIKEKKKKIRI